MGISHLTHDHPRTSASRAQCRRDRERESLVRELDALEVYLDSLPAYVADLRARILRLR